MKFCRASTLLTLLCALTLAVSLHAAPPPGYYLVWGDEFNGSSLDASKWALRLGGTYRDGYNTLNAVSVNGGNLVIRTYTSGGVNYTAMLYAKGKFEAKFGYWESRIKWSDSNAVWSSPWLLSRGYSLSAKQLAKAPDNNDPLTFGSEIDICEHRYVNSANHNIANYVQANLHWKNGTANVDDPGSPLVPSTGGLATGFHTYGLLWKTNSYSFLIDGVQVYSNRPATPVVHAAEYPLLTSAVDDTRTTWAGHIPPGGYGSQATSATKFTVDYIRYYAPTNDHFWTGAGSAYWFHSVNWISNLPPTPGSDLTFSYLSKANRNMVLGLNYTVNGLVFLGSAGAFTFNAGNTLTLGADGIDMVSANHNVTLDTAVNIAANQTWAVGPNDPNGGLTLTVNGNVSGAATLTKASYGTVILHGANSFSGALNVDTGSSEANDGILKITNPNALAHAASIAIRNTGTGVSIFQLDGSSGNITVPAPIGLAGRGTNVAAIENLSGNNTLAGGITLAEGGNEYMLQADVGTLALGGTISAGSTATGSRTLTLQGVGNFSISAAIQNGSASALNLVKTNSGALTLAGTNTYSGATTEWRGTLFVNGSLASPLVVNGGILSGTGAVVGAATVQSGGELSPGAAVANSIGTLTFGDNLTLASGSTTRLEINAASQTNDQVNVAGALSCAGTLDVVNLGGTLLPGQSFKLLNADTITEKFSGQTLPPLHAGLVWDTNALMKNGILSVVALPRNLGVTNLDRGQLQLNWDYGQLRNSTNLAGPYNTVTGAAPPYVIRVTNPQQFYRLLVE